MYNVGFAANENNLSSKATNPPQTCEQVVNHPSHPLADIDFQLLTQYIYIYILSSRKKGCTIAGNCICAVRDQIRGDVVRLPGYDIKSASAGTRPRIQSGNCCCNYIGRTTKGKKSNQIKVVLEQDELRIR